MKKEDKINLRVPGPTPLPPEILNAISSQMINHRGHQWEEMQARVTENLKYFFQTENDLFLFTSSGMGGLEAAISNFFSPGDTIVSFTCGEFGHRWAEVARRYSAQVTQIKFPAGKSVSKDEVYRILSQMNKVDGVIITHNETSSGVLNNIKNIAPLVKTHKSKPLLLIDSISALGAVDLPMDDLDIDVLISASQKAWMAPPGMAFIAVSPYAWEKHRTAKNPRYYFDLTMYKEFSVKNQTPATPAVSVLFGLDKSLELMKKEGRENIYKRHLFLMERLREGIRKIRLQLFVSDEDASPTVTSLKVPEEIEVTDWLKILREKYHCVLAGGMGETKGKIIRVAHMGYVSKEDIDEVLSALKQSLLKLSRPYGSPR